MVKYLVYIISVIGVSILTFLVLIFNARFIAGFLNLIVGQQNAAVVFIILSAIIFASIPFILGHFLLHGIGTIQKVILPTAMTLIIITASLAFVFTGVSGFGCAKSGCSRDTKRIADMQLMQAYLEQYNNKFGHYPGSGDGTKTAPSIWGPATIMTSLSASLKIAIDANIPDDPFYPRSPDGTIVRHYFYAVSPDFNSYILGAILEKDNTTLKRPEEIDSIPPNFIVPPGMDCDDKNLGFCLGS